MNRLFNILRSKNEAFSAPQFFGGAEDTLARWCALYENTVPAGDGKSLNLAKAIASEVARLVTLELDTAISGGKRARYLNEQYQRAVMKARSFVETAAAKGGVILKPYVDNGKIYVSVIGPENFSVSEFSEDTGITGAVFYERIFSGGIWYTRLEEHKKDDDGYIITNKAYKSRTRGNIGKQIPVSSVLRWRDIKPYCRIKNTQRPLFVYFKMPGNDPSSKDSPFGTAVFAPACDLILDAYRQYSDLLWEFESGKRALYLDESAVRRDEEGRALLPEKRLYRMLTTDNDALFEEWSPQLREESILKGLDRILKSIEFCCGLAYGTISDPADTDKTAEEIRASKQRSFATVTDIQTELEKALTSLAEVMDIFCDIYSLAPRGDHSISFSFDDSIISDREAEFSHRSELLDKGVIAPYEMRMWYLGESVEKARERTGETDDVHKRNCLAQGKFKNGEKNIPARNGKGKNE